MFQRILFHGGKLKMKNMEKRSNMIGGEDQK
jgi:hypothetical protein